MKTSSKKIILILLIIALAIYVFIRTVQQSTESPAGIYISEINSKDTLRLYPDGKFEQVVYNNKNILGTHVYLNGVKRPREYASTQYSYMMIQNN